MEHYLNLRSSNSLMYHPSNTPLDFTVELGRDMILEGEWKIALLDFACELGDSDHLRVCCDVCCPSWVDDQYLPVIRTFPASQGRHYFAFAFPYYVPTHSHVLKRIKVYIQE